MPYFFRIGITPRYNNLMQFKEITKVVFIFTAFTINLLMPGGNKKVVSVCVTFLLPPGIKGLRFYLNINIEYKCSCFQSFSVSPLALHKLKYTCRWRFRSSHHTCSIKKGALKNFVTLTGKHLRWSLLLIKLQTFRPATLLKWNKYFPVNITKFLRTLILKNICERLLLRVLNFSAEQG